MLQRKIYFQERSIIRDALFINLLLKTEEVKEKTADEIEQDKKERMDEKAEDELEKQLEFLNTGDDSKRLLKSARSRTVRFSEEPDDNKAKEEEGEEVIFYLRNFLCVMQFLY